MKKKKQEYCYVMWHEQYGSVPSSARRLRRDCLDDWHEETAMSSKYMKERKYRCIKTILTPQPNDKRN